MPILREALLQFQQIFYVVPYINPTPEVFPDVLNGIYVRRKYWPVYNINTLLLQKGLCRLRCSFPVIVMRKHLKTLTSQLWQHYRVKKA
ncbi:hypothetical protein RRG08_008121 [Elysia crispata]|uniref:Uncharacterized protein n=1 Tax=Elysia crispata TaxID=231223 RepID=A0AAE1D6T0_9GAST|nr:hypothetical protein RRG08_008121 [Elysia crispata]